MSYHKMDGFGDAPHTERHSSSDSSQDSSFIEERAARTLARARGDHSATSVSSRDSSAFSSGLLSPTVCSDCSTLRPLNEGTVSMGGDGDASLAESMRSLGQLGSPNDWDFANLVPRIDGGAASAHPEHASPPVEFPPHLPPTTFPGLAPSPLLAPTTASATRHFRAPSAPVRARGLPISLLDPLMMRGAAAMMGGEPMAGARSPFHPADLSQAALQHFLLMNAFPSYVREAWSMEQNAPPPSRRVRLYSTTRSSDRRNSSSSSSTDGSSSSRALDCSYCRSVLKDPSGHNKHNCPILADLPPCRICGAEGKYNHTETHCPDTPKTDLQFIPKMSRVRSFTF